LVETLSYVYFQSALFGALVALIGAVPVSLSGLVVSRVSGSQRVRRNGFILGVMLLSVIFLVTFVISLLSKIQIENAIISDRCELRTYTIVYDSFLDCPAVHILEFRDQTLHARLKCGYVGECHQRPAIYRCNDEGVFVLIGANKRFRIDFNEMKVHYDEGCGGYELL